jgi:hypothetical protein
MQEEKEEVKLYIFGKYLGDVTAVLCVTHIVTTGKAYGRYII